MIRANDDVTQQQEKLLDFGRRTRGQTDVECCRLVLRSQKQPGYARLGEVYLQKQKKHVKIIVIFSKCICSLSLYS